MSSSKKIVRQKPIPLIIVRKLLEKRQNRATQGISTEFMYQQQTTLDYARKMSRNTIYTPDLAQNIMKKFNIDEEKAIQLIDTNPSTPLELKPFFPRLSEKELKEYLDFYLEERAKAELEMERWLEEAFSDDDEEIAPRW